MDRLLTALAASADATRLRLLALAGFGTFCVVDFVEILGQSQPRLSRHLRLLSDAGLLERAREGANSWFSLPQGDAGGLARALLKHLPEQDPILAADRREAARVLAERARIASARFRRQGADWDEMRALDLPAPAVEERLLALLAGKPLGRLLDIGTGTGRSLELLAPAIEAGLGIDASRAMLALARVRLAQPELSHCTVRQADMYALPLPSAAFDTVMMQMVLHHAEDLHAALAEAVRVLRPAGRLIVVDLAAHGQAELARSLAHRWVGFSDETMSALLASVGLRQAPSLGVSGRLELRIWLATKSCSETLPAASPDPLLKVAV